LRKGKSRRTCLIKISAFLVIINNEDNPLDWCNAFSHNGLRHRVHSTIAVSLNESYIFIFILTNCESYICCNSSWTKK